MKFFKLKKSFYYFSAISFFGLCANFYKLSLFKINSVSACKYVKIVEENYAERDNDVQITTFIREVAQNSKKIKNDKNLDFKTKNLELKKFFCNCSQQLENMFSNGDYSSIKNVNLRFLTYCDKLFDNLFKKIDFKDFNDEVKTSFSNFKKKFKDLLISSIQQLHESKKCLLEQFNLYFNNLKKYENFDFFDEESFGEFCLVFSEFISFVESCGVNLCNILVELKTSPEENLLVTFGKVWFKINLNLEQILESISNKEYDNLNLKKDNYNKLFNFQVDDYFIKVFENSKRLFTKFCYSLANLRNNNLSKNNENFYFWKKRFKLGNKKKEYLSPYKIMLFTGFDYFDKYELLKKINDKNIQLMQCQNLIDLNKFFCNLDEFTCNLEFVLDNFKLLDNLEIQTRIFKELNFLLINISKFIKQNNFVRFLQPGSISILKRFANLVGNFRFEILKSTSNLAIENNFLENEKIFKETIQKLDSLLVEIGQINAESLKEDGLCDLDYEKINRYLNDLNSKYITIKKYLVQGESFVYYQKFYKILKAIYERFKSVYEDNFLDNNSLFKKLYDFIIICENAGGNFEMTDSTIPFLKDKALFLNNKIIPNLKFDNLIGDKFNFETSNCLKDFEELLYAFKALISNFLNVYDYNKNHNGKIDDFNLFFDIYKVISSSNKYKVYYNFNNLKDLFYNLKVYYDGIIMTKKLKNSNNLIIERNKLFLTLYENTKDILNKFDRIYYIFDQIKEQINCHLKAEYNVLKFDVSKMVKTKNSKLIKPYYNFIKQKNNLCKKVGDWNLKNCFDEKLNNDLENFKSALNNFQTQLSGLKTDKIIKNVLQVEIEHSQELCDAVENKISSNK